MDTASGALAADRASLPTPAAYWSFDTFTDGTHARVREDSGQGAFGVMSGRGLCSPGRFLSAGDFDGVGDQVEISSAGRSYLDEIRLYQQALSAAQVWAGANLQGDYTGFAIVGDWVLEPISGVREPLAIHCGYATWQCGTGVPKGPSRTSSGTRWACTTWTATPARRSWHGAAITRRPISSITSS